MEAFDPAALRPAEQAVVDCTALGEWAVLSGRQADELGVRAAFVRHALLRLPALPGPDGRLRDPWPMTGAGLRIRGARIEGALDLTDCAGPDGAALAGLALEDCDIGADLDLSNARLAWLSLRDSRIVCVRLRGAKLEGPLDFSGVRSAQSGDAGVAWIDAHGCTIRGELRGTGARLQAPPKRAQVVPGQERYALRLSDAEVDGTVDLMGGVVAIGGVNVGGAQIRGDLYAIGARLTAGEGKALHAQAASIGGGVLLDRLSAQGAVWLLESRIGGTLQCDGASFANRTSDGSGVALEAANAQIGGGVLLCNGCTAAGQVSLLGARITGNLECDGASFANRTPDGSGVALVAANAEIGDDVLLRNGFTAAGRVSLLGAKINGGLTCVGASFANRTPDGSGVALDAENAEIGGAVLLRNGFTAQGRVSLLGARIEGSVECGGALLVNLAGEQPATSLNLTNAQVGGDLLLNGGFANVGSVSVWGCRIARDLDCTRARLIAPPPGGALPHWQSALDATNAPVGGDVILSGATVLGRLEFQHADITGSLTWDGTSFPPQIEVRFPPKMQRDNQTWRYRGTAAREDAGIGLANARIGAALQALNLLALVPMLIDLEGAHAQTLDDEGFPAGWGDGPELGGKRTGIPSLHAQPRRLRL